jgi:lipopolysaccharide cholinephosphotransferase
MDSDEYFYQCIQTDVDHINMFGKFRKKEGGLMSTDRRSAYFKYSGVGFDVFSIEKSSQFAAHMAKFFYLNMQHPTQYIKNNTLRHFMIRLVQVINFGLLLPLTRLIGLINPKGEYHYELGSGFYDQPLHYEDIFPLTTIEFEGVTFPAPKDTDMYLKRLYGDWRKLPSEEEIKKAMHYPLYKEEIFGKEE